MFATFSRSWNLFQASLRVLNKDRKLLIFPLLSSVILVLIVATFIIPLIWATDFFSPEASGDLNGGIYVGFFFFYFISYALTYFFNAAIISCAIFRMKGGEPNIKGGIMAARSRLGSILGWAFISATIGLILKAIQNRSGAVGKIVVGLIGVAWSVASYLVVPVIVMERKGPVDAIKESVALVKKTWGEQVVGNIGLGFFMFLIVTPAILLIIVATMMVTSEILMMIIISFAVIYVILASLLQSTLSAIFDAALYLYAREDFVPDGFDRGLIRDIMKPN